METEFLFRLLLAALLILFPLHRGWQTRRRAPDSQRVDAELETQGAKVVGILGVIALLSSLAYIVVPAWIGWAALPLPSWLRWSGVPLALAGFAVLEWAQHALAHNWSDTPVKLRDHSLTTGGPYAYVRHPIYTGFLLILAAPLLLSANWLVGAAWIAMTALDVHGRAVAEEAMLAKTFGQEFEAYKGKTGRFFPTWR